MTAWAFTRTVIPDEAAFCLARRSTSSWWMRSAGSWQLSTVQFDFTLPRRFELEYIAEDGKKHRPVMVHRALFGSVERFFGILVEHYAEHFPRGSRRCRRRFCRSPTGRRSMRDRGRARSLRRPGSARRPWTIAAKKSTLRSVTRRCRRCPTCWWSEGARVDAGQVAVRHRKTRRSWGPPAWRNSRVQLPRK